MSLIDRIESDFKTALKARDSLTTSVLRMLKAEVKNREIDMGGKLDEDALLGVINSQVKKRRESVQLYEKGGRQDLADKENSEIEALLKYLPEQMSEEAVREKVREVIGKLGSPDIKQMGQVMKAAMAEIGKRADGSLVSGIVRELLQGK